VPDEALQHDCGIDAYLFLRYIKFLLALTAPLALILLPVLLSMNLVGGEGTNGGISGLDQLSWSNIGLQQPSHLWGHLGCALVAITWACFLITRELTIFAKIREAYILASPAGQVYLVLLTDVPRDMLSRERLADFYDVFGSALCDIQIHRDFTKLANLICKRVNVQFRLEKAYTKLIKSNVRAYGKCKDLPGPRETIRLPICKWIPTIPLLGPKVDKISHLEREIVTLSRSILKIQQTLEDAPETTSAILQFTDEHTARLISRSVNLPIPHCMQPHYIGSTPSNILWKNFGLGWWNRRLREVFTSLIAILALFGWSVPIAFSGLLSQLHYLSQLFPWLRALDQLPMWVTGMVQGVLPQVITAVLMLIFPLFLRYLVEQQGHYDKVRIELRVQSWYFAFLFLHLFLTVSIASGLAPVLAELVANPRSASTILAQNLPKASNYFLSYVPLQAFTTAAVVFTQAITFTRKIALTVFDRTPREEAVRRLTIPEVQWGTLFPTYTNLACIGKHICS
jgi:calcium permeable stress-gated cation channel